MMNAQLRTLYGDLLPSLDGVTAGFDGVSRPLLMEVPESYGQAAFRLMIVGQQTRYWGEECESVNHLMAFYSGFELGRTQRRSQFWQAAHRLYRHLNPGCPEGGFLWSNLVKVDQHGGRIREPGLEDAVVRVGLLQGEIAITEPQAVIFFTGPSFDASLASSFPGAVLEPVSDNLLQVRHPALPIHSYRTYHPRYLKRSGRWGVLDDIVSRCRASA